MPSSDAVQQRLYSPVNHISPGKSSSCFNKRPTSSASATTPPCGVLKNVMVSHHMDRSSSTPRLTLKFHHVKRHENGVTTAADVSRLHAGTDGSVHLPTSVSAAGKTTSSISYVDSQCLTASLPSARYHRVDGDAEGHQVLKNSLEKTQNSMSADSHQSVVMPFSPQFEDISDAEDDVRPTTVNQRDSVRTSPTYSLPPPASQCLPQLSAGLYPSPVGSMFCTSAAVTVAASHPSIIGWSSYSGFPSQTTGTLPASMGNVGPPSGSILPWVGENRSQMGAVNRLSAVMNSTGNSGHILPADMLHMNLSSRQPFLGNRFAGSDGTGCLKSELPLVKSESLQTDKSYGHQMSLKLENCNGHVGDIKSDPSCIKAEYPSTYVETSREPCSSTLENKLSFFAAFQSKSEETVLSNSDTSVGSHHIAEDTKDNMKTDSRDSEPSFRNRLLIKPEIGNTSPPRYSSCLHSSATSISPSLQTSYLEPDVAAVSYLTPSEQVTADVTQVPNSLEPKVPPLRIIIPSKVCSSGSLSDGLNTNITSRCGVGSLPYVVNRTHSADSDVVNNTADEVHRSDSSPAVFPSSSDNDRLSVAKEASAGSELVPAKRRKIKHSSKVSVHGDMELIVVIICYTGYDCC